MMKNKIVYLITAFIAITTFANASYEPMENEWYTQAPMQNEEWGVHDAYRYVSFGVGPVVIIPNIGIGYRERHCQFGWDAALSFSTVGVAHQLTGHWVRHYYLNPYKADSAYLGLGVIGSGIVTNDGHGFGSLSPDFVFGKTLESNDETRSFVEMHVGIPTLWFGKKHAKVNYIPLMYVKYGISF